MQEAGDLTGTTPQTYRPQFWSSLIFRVFGGWGVVFGARAPKDPKTKARGFHAPPRRVELASRPRFPWPLCTAAMSLSLRSASFFWVHSCLSRGTEEQMGVSYFKGSLVGKQAMWSGAWLGSKRTTEYGPSKIIDFLRAKRVNDAFACT